MIPALDESMRFHSGQFPRFGFLGFSPALFSLSLSLPSLSLSLSLSLSPLEEARIKKGNEGEAASLASLLKGMVQVLLVHSSV